MTMEPPPSRRPASGVPFPVPPRSGPQRAAERRSIPATSLFDLLPEPDPALVRPSEKERLRTERANRRGRLRRSWRQRALLGVLMVGALVATSAATVAGYLSYKLDQIDYVEVALSEAPAPGQPRNYLIVGSDSRDALVESDLDGDAFTGDDSVGSGQRSDTIMVARVNPAEESVDVLSIPRDLWVPIPSTGGSQRINVAYGSGPQRLIDTIESTFAIPIHHYVEVDFVGFGDLVAAIGGVPMWFDTPMRDRHSGLIVDAAGCQVLDSQMALAFARSRHLEYQNDNGRWSTDGTGDLGRITRQQVFLRRALDQVSTLGITDVLTLNRLLDVGIDSVTLDRGLGLGQLGDLGRRFATFAGDALRTYSLPVYPFTTSGGAAVLGWEVAEAEPTLNLFRGLPPGTLSPVMVDGITVLNGTGVGGQAALVADALAQIGFGVADTDNAEETGLARTRIRHGTSGEPAAALLERHLTGGAELIADSTLEPDDVVLELGLDFTTIGRNPRPAPPALPSPAGEAPVTDELDIPAFDPIGVAPDPSANC